MPCFSADPWTLGPGPPHVGKCVFPVAHFCFVKTMRKFSYVLKLKLPICCTWIFLRKHVRILTTILNGWKVIKKKNDHSMTRAFLSACFTSFTGELLFSKRNISSSAYFMDTEIIENHSTFCTLWHIYINSLFLTHMFHWLLQSYSLSNFWNRSFYWMILWSNLSAE